MSSLQDFVLKFHSCAFCTFTVCVVTPHPPSFDRSVSICVQIISFLLRRFRKIVKNEYSLHHVCQLVHLSLSFSVHMEQIGSYWKDFHGIWYWNIFWKFLEKIQVSIKSDKNKVYFVRRPMYKYVNILHNYSWNKKCLRKIFRENHSFYIHCCLKRRLLLHNEEKYSRLRQTANDVIPCMRFACWIIKATNTQSEYVILIAFTPQPC